MEKKIKYSLSILVHTYLLIFLLIRNNSRHHSRFAISQGFLKNFNKNKFRTKIYTIALIALFLIDGETHVFQRI